MDDLKLTYVGLGIEYALMSNRNSEIAKSILEVFYAIGLISLSLVSPNLGGLIAKHLKNQYTERQINRSLKSLQKQSVIRIYKTKKYTNWILTEKGRIKFFEQSAISYKINKNKIDGFYRFIMFDVPNTHNRNRRLFTSWLKRAGLNMLQKSIWICHFDCEDAIDEAANFYKIKTYVLILRVRESDNAKLIRTLRNLIYKI